jgi:predicted porin
VIYYSESAFIYRAIYGRTTQKTINDKRAAAMKPNVNVKTLSLSTLGLHNSLKVTLSVLALFSSASWALDFGPDNMFSLTGFAKAEVGRGSHQCIDCQRFPGEDKQRLWADEVVPGREYKTANTHVTLFQPYLGAKYDLGSGYKLSGLLSQRWRDGKVDIKGSLYEKNVALAHEDYGRLAYGAMTTRGWSLADYPYGSNIGLAEVWGSSGAGYGMVGKTLRYTTRQLDVFDGDLVLEGSYDRGNTTFKTHKPRFIELYSQYHKGDLVIDAMYQDARNGKPVAWGHAPFSGLTDNAADDAKLGGSGQSIAMAMARYQIDSKIEVSGGIRRNRWSGAYAVITEPGAAAQWNSMFNVDWNGTLNGVSNPGYAATSTDLMLGARYRMAPWLFSAGFVHLGTAKSNNPSERGQSNAATIGALGAQYDVGNGVQVYAGVGAIQYKKLGLSPISMPGNAAFTKVDSRVNKNGNWLNIGVVYTF